MTSPVQPPSRLPSRVAALLEQGLVSGANFLAFILLARALAAEAWGAFGLAYAVVLFVQGWQRALVTIPMITFTAGGAGWPAARLQWLGVNTALAAAAALLLVLMAGSVALAHGGWRMDWPPGRQTGWLAQSLLMAALMLVPVMAHEFCRRAAIQEARLDLLAGTGAAYAGVLVVTAAAPWPSAWAAWSGCQPALAVALACMAAAAVYRLRTALPVLATWQRPPPNPVYRTYTGWALASHLAYSGYNFGVQALLAAVAGPAALGAFHACRTLVQPVTTLQSAMDSIDKPRAAAALAREGTPGLRRVLRRAMAVLALLAVPYLALVAWGAGPLLAWLYGDRYAEQQAVVSMWCLVALCSVISQPVESGLYVARQTRALFAARAVAALASLALALALTVSHGAVGALAAMALGFALAAGLGLFQLQRLPVQP